MVSTDRVTRPSLPPIPRRSRPAVCRNRSARRPGGCSSKNHPEREASWLPSPRCAREAERGLSGAARAGDDSVPTILDHPDRDRPDRAVLQGDINCDGGHHERAVRLPGHQIGRRDRRRALRGHPSDDPGPAALSALVVRLRAAVQPVRGPGGGLPGSADRPVPVDRRGAVVSPRPRLPRRREGPQRMATG
jgi:hypothetical protein